MRYLKILSLKLTLSCIIFKSLRLYTISGRGTFLSQERDTFFSLIYFLGLQCDSLLCLQCDVFFVPRVWYIFLCRVLFFFSLTFCVTRCDKHVQNMFKRDVLQSHFRIFLTGNRLFANVKFLVVLLTTDLSSNTKNYIL